jgi:hypothetical protein
MQAAAMSKEVKTLYAATKAFFAPALLSDATRTRQERRINFQTKFIREKEVTWEKTASNERCTLAEFHKFAQAKFFAHFESPLAKALSLSGDAS